MHAGLSLVGALGDIDRYGLVYGLAGLAVFLVLCYLVVSKFSKSFKGRFKFLGQHIELEGTSHDPAPEPTRAPVPVPAVAAGPVASHSVSLRSADDLVPERILEEIRQLPPLVQPEIQKSYVGISVCWDGELFSAEAVGDGLIRVWMARLRRKTGFSQPASILFLVRRAEYPELATMNREHPLRVRGRIKDISAAAIGGRIELANAELLSPPPDEGIRPAEPEKPPPSPPPAPLEVTVDFQHDCGTTVFVKVVVRNSQEKDDEINAVILETYPTTEWKVLVPELAPGVPIQATAWPQWTHSFPLHVPANRSLVFWVSGYLNMGIIENNANALVGKIFVFNVRARSGDKKVDTKLRKKP